MPGPSRFTKRASGYEFSVDDEFQLLAEREDQGDHRVTVEQKTTWARTIPIVATLILLSMTLVSTTIAILKGQDQVRTAVQITQIVTVISEMQKVDRDIALQIERNRGETSTEVAVIRKQIENIGTLLQEIKSSLTSHVR